MAPSHSLIRSVLAALAGVLVEALMFLPGSPAGAYLEAIFGVSSVVLIQVLLGLLGLVLLGYAAYVVVVAVVEWRRTFQAELVGKGRFLLGETAYFKAWFKGELKNGLFTCKVTLPNGKCEWWPAYDTFRRTENGDLGILSGRGPHEAEWSASIRSDYPSGQYAAQIGVWDRIDLGSKNRPLKEKQVSFWVVPPGYGSDSGGTGFTQVLSGPAIQPELTIPISELKSTGEVKELEVRFPDGITVRKHPVCFYYVTVRAKGQRTVENVFAYFDGNPLKIVPRTEKPSFGIDYNRLSVKKFDEAGPQEFVYALLREQKKTKDGIKYLHPGPGQDFALFLGVKGLEDFFIVGNTFLWYDRRKGLCGLHRDDGTGTLKLGLRLDGQDAIGCTVMFEVTFRKWDSFSVTAVKFPQQVKEEG
jgi:hypothetical protein